MNLVWGNETMRFVTVGLVEMRTPENDEDKFKGVLSMKGKS